MSEDMSETINICNVAEYCNTCPFESECDYAFENNRTKQEITKMLNEKTRRIKSMLAKLNEVIT